MAGPASGAEPVHVGYDTLWLLELALAVEPAERAVELGTGSGLVAATLGREWPVVAATEIVPCSQWRGAHRRVHRHRCRTTSSRV